MRNQVSVAMIPVLFIAVSNLSLMTQVDVGGDGTLVLAPARESVASGRVDELPMPVVQRP